MPLDTDAARAFLQRRVAFFSLIGTILIGGIQLVGRIANLGPDTLIERTMGKLALPSQLFSAVIFLGIWLRTRTGIRTLRELHALDALGVISPLFAAAGAVSGLPVVLRPELMTLIALAHIMMARAVIVPSSARRTFVLGAIATVPVPFATYFYYRSWAGSGLPPVAVYTIGASAWSVASVGLSTITSITIFGLRAKVVAATQLGQYTLERKIGQGGMGVVYRARHALLRRPTAVKLLSPERTEARDYERFEREVQLTSQLTHPNTISIYDYGRTPEGIFYYAMEYLDGLDLQQLIERDGPQAPGCVARVLEHVSGALAEAHGHGLIHRDIKPANVILCERGGEVGVAKVVDFGLVKNIDTTATSSSSSVAAIVGTPLYLSPEAITTPASIDARSDLYSVGALGYFLLTGAPVFSGATIVEVCGHHLHSTPPAPSRQLGRDVPEDLERLILKLLAKRPEERPASAAELTALFASSPSRIAWTRADSVAWWARVRARRDAPRQAGLPATTPGTSQTLAVDFRKR